MVPDVPCRNCPDTTDKESVVMESEPELTWNPVVEESTESVTVSCDAPTTEKDCVCDTEQFQSSLENVPFSRDMVKDE